MSVFCHTKLGLLISMDIIRFGMDVNGKKMAVNECFYEWLSAAFSSIKKLWISFLEFRKDSWVKNEETYGTSATQEINIY